MSELPKHIYNEKNGLHYTLYGDYYFLDFGLSESDQEPLGRWGLMCKTDLEENHLGKFIRMLLGGTLMDYLHSIDEQAESMYDTLMKGYQKSWNITEELKAKDQMKWVQMMNLGKAEAENIIVREIIYG